MKLSFCSLALFGFCVAAALTPSDSFADPVARSSKERQRIVVNALQETAKHPNRTVYIISNSSITGSNIPSVTRVYRGVSTTQANRTISYADLGITGSDDVAGALYKLDPSFTHGLGR